MLTNGSVTMHQSTKRKINLFQSLLGEFRFKKLVLILRLQLRFERTLRQPPCEVDERTINPFSDEEQEVKYFCFAFQV